MEMKIIMYMVIYFKSGNNSKIRHAFFLSFVQEKNSLNLQLTL